MCLMDAEPHGEPETHNHACRFQPHSTKYTEIILQSAKRTTRAPGFTELLFSPRDTYTQFSIQTSILELDGAEQGEGGGVD